MNSIRIILRIISLVGFGLLIGYGVDGKSCRTDIARLSETTTGAACLKNVPSRFLSYPNFFDLAFDPDRDAISPQTVREAMAAIELVAQGRLVGPLTRAPAKSSADFVDGEGNGFDIKARGSLGKVRTLVFDPDELQLKIREKINHLWHNEISGQIKPIKVFVDLTHLSASDRQHLFKMLEREFTPEERRNIETLEIPEPIRILKANRNLNASIERNKL